MKRLLTILAASSLTACATVAPQVATPSALESELKTETARLQDAALDAQQARFERVQRVWRRLVLANEELCAARGRDAGFTLHSLNSYPVEMRDAAVRRFAIDQRPTVDFVAPSSAAAIAGLSPGDIIVTVNGEAIREARLNRRNSRRDRALDDAAEKIGAVLEGQAPLTLQVQRDGQARAIAFTPEPACDYRLVIARDDRVNAAANGRVVAISTGMVRYLNTDAELAVVLGHELGHNALTHRDRQRNATRPGRWGGTAAGILLGAATGVFIDFGALGARGSEEMRLTFEREADYVGIYFAARAGYEVDGVEEFWRRFAADYPSSTYLTRTHPTAAERFLSIAAAQREIEQKRAANQDLRPNPAQNSQ